MASKRNILARGAFSTFFEMDGNHYLETFDPIKEIYDVEGVWAQQTEGFRHFPMFRRVPELETDKWHDVTGFPYKVYQTEKYDPLDASVEVAWAQYKRIKELWTKAEKSGKWTYVNPNADRTDMMNLFLKLVKEDESYELPERLRHEIIQVGSLAMNYGYPGFEITPRNVKCDKCGFLILLDCFYLPEMLHKIDEAKRKKNGYGSGY